MVGGLYFVALFNLNKDEFPTIQFKLLTCIHLNIIVHDDVTHIVTEILIRVGQAGFFYCPQFVLSLFNDNTLNNLV